MRPLRIYMKNFMNHRLSEIDCTNFQSVLIVGRSHKNERVSNAIGKTTIFRAIEYVLFNQSHSTTLDKIVREGKKKAVVEFDFELSGEVYRIYRHRTSTESADVRLYKKVNGEFESISERTPSGTDTKIRDLIKISHKAFTYSVLFRQADLTGITSVSDPKKRKEILKEPLNLAVYTKLEELATKKVRPLKKELDKFAGSVSVLGNPEEDIQKAQKELEGTLEELKTHRELIEKANSDVEFKRQAVEELKLSLGQQDIDIHRKVSEQESILKKLKDTAKISDKRLLGISNLILIKEEELKKSENDLQQAQIKLVGLNNTDTDIEDLQNKYNEVCADEVKGSGLLSSVKTQMSITKKSLPEGDECPACHQSITPDYREQIANDLKKKLTKLQSDVEFLEDALSKCRRKKAKLDENLKAERVRSNEISRLENQMEGWRNVQKSLREETDRLYVDQKEIANKLRDDGAQIIEISKVLEALVDSARKSNAPVITNKIFDINKEISQIQENIIGWNRRISALSSVQGGLEERISTRNADKLKLIELRGNLEKTNRELRIRQMVVDAFSNRGIPNFIIQKVLDELQYEANAALKELRPDLDVQIDADLNFEYRYNGTVKDYTQLSHGQHVYIALAFKRGMANVLQRKANTSIKFLEFDEVDAHFDEAGVDAFADAIRKWQKDFTIFVITHNKDLKDKFAHAIIVEDSDDGAEARLVNSW